MDSIVFENELVEASESQSGDLLLKFIICDFKPNHNKMQLNINSEKLEECVQTLVGQPLVGKVVSFNGKEDFTGHNRVVSYKLLNGKLIKNVEYDTSGLGIFTEAGIETIEDETYIVATAKLFKRFKKAREIILNKIENQEPIYSSWEMDIKEEHQEGAIRVFDDWQFTAHCLLGSKEGKAVSPAYDCSHIMEVEIAEKQNEEMVVEDEFLGELITAIAEDLTTESTVGNSTIDININKEDSEIGGNDIMSKNVEASLTARDLEDKIRQLIYTLEAGACCYGNIMIYPLEFVAYAKKYAVDSKDEDYTKFNYVVTSDDTVSIVSQEDVTMVFVPKEVMDTQLAELEGKVSELEDSKVELSEKITNLVEQIAEKDSAIAELTPFKEKVEAEELAQAEAERLEKVAELQAYAEKVFSAEVISQNEELTKAIAELDDKFVKIAVANELYDRMVKAEEDKKEEAEVEETKEEDKKEEAEVDAEVNLDGLVEEIEPSININSIYARNRRKFGR